MAPPNPSLIASVLSEKVPGPIYGGRVVLVVAFNRDSYLPVKCEYVYIIWTYFLRCIHAFLPGYGSCSGGCKSNLGFVYYAGRLATSSQKTHCDGFLYSSGQPVEDDHRLCKGFDEGAESRPAA
jgi:hypothetical protein